MLLHYIIPLTIRPVASAAAAAAPPSFVREGVGQSFSSSHTNLHTHPSSLSFKGTQFRVKHKWVIFNMAYFFPSSMYSIITTENFQDYSPLEHLQPLRGAARISLLWNPPGYWSQWWERQQWNASVCGLVDGACVDFPKMHRGVEIRLHPFLASYTLLLCNTHTHNVSRKDTNIRSKVCFKT